MCIMIYPHSPSGAVRPRASCVYISALKYFTSGDTCPIVQAVTCSISHLWAYSTRSCLGHSHSVPFIHYKKVQHDYRKKLLYWWLNMDLILYESVDNHLSTLEDSVISIKNVVYITNCIWTAVYRNVA